MKKTLSIAIVLLLISTISQSQVAINTDGSSPDASAMLDIKSSSMGLLVPRMTDTEMNTITNPANGLIIYSTTQNNFFFYDGTSWEHVVGSDDNDWTLSGNDMYNINTGNIGLGTPSPVEKLSIDGNIYLGHCLWEEERKISMGSSIPLIEIARKAYSQQMILGSGLSTASYGGFLFQIHGVNRMVMDSQGFVGIGNSTSSVSAPLHVFTAPDVTPISGGGLIVGLVDDINIAMDGNEIMARNNGLVTGLILNNEGGDVVVSPGGTGFLGVGIAIPTERLHINGNMRLTGALYDVNNFEGTSGQVLSSTVSGVDWVDANAHTHETLTNGTGISGTVYNGSAPVTWSHADLSTQTSVNNSNGVVLQDVQLDGEGLGHVAGLVSVDLDTRYSIGSGTPNYVTKWTGAKSLGNSVIYDDGNNVGIGTPSPTAKLDVDGTLRFRQTNPAPYKVLTSTDNNGNATWVPNRSLRYPDGQFPMTPVTHRFSSGTYVVPGGKNLYITNVFNPYGGSYYVMINGQQVMRGYNNYNAFNTTEGPIIAGPGHSVQSNNSNIAFNGFLVDATVQAVTTTSPITVPAGQTLVITSICGLGSLRALIVNGIALYQGYGNFTTSTNNYHGLREPVFVGSGMQVSYNGGVMNGYFITQ